MGSAKRVARNTTRVMLPDAALVTNSLKFAKALVVTAEDSVVCKRTGGQLPELVPQRDPATLKAGEALEMRVLFKRQPQADAEIELSKPEDIPARPGAFPATPRAWRA